MKPVNLITRLIRPTLINSFMIKKLEIDLRHINYGMDSEKSYARKPRSSFGENDIVEFFESLNGLEATPSYDDNWEYFVVDKPFFEKKKRYRIVFCIDLNEPGTCGIITLFQVKRGNQ